MENIRHFFGIKLSTPSIRSFLKKNNGGILYPYKNVVVSINEVHICPFCGKIVQGLECNCKAFEKAFVKLQNSYGDDKHESCFYRSDWDLIVASISKPVSEFKIRTLTKKEVLNFGLDLWDNSIRYSDDLSDRSYLVTPANLEGENLFLLCKDLVSKHVYRLETPNPEYVDKPVYLGIHERKFIPGRDKRRIGNYHIEYSWRELNKCADWNEVCEALKKI